MNVMMLLRPSRWPASWTAHTVPATGQRSPCFRQAAASGEQGLSVLVPINPVLGLSCELQLSWVVSSGPQAAANFGLLPVLPMPLWPWPAPIYNNSNKTNYNNNNNDNNNYQIR